MESMIRNSLSVNDRVATGPLDVMSTFREEDPVAWRQWHHWNKANGLVRIFLETGIQVLTLHTVAEGQMNYCYLEFVAE